MRPVRPLPTDFGRSDEKGILRMTRGMVAVVCSLSLAGGCGSSDKGSGGTGGAGGMNLDAAAAGGTGGSGGSATGGSGGSATGGSGGGAGGAADAGPGDGPAATMANMMIGSASGGTLASGAATLLVPAGALPADKVLTVSVQAPEADLPGRESINGDVYDFGPSGTTFTVPAALTLPLSGGLPAGKRAVVAWLDPAAGQWFPVPSTVDGDKVRGLVTHFTRFALLLLPDTALCPAAGACGGSLDGTWKYTNSCLKATESDVAQCGTAGAVKMRQEYQVGGTVTIAQGRYTTQQMITASATLFYTPACLAEIRGAGVPNADCATLQEAWRKQNPAAVWVCAGTLEQGCSCLLTQTLAGTSMGAVVITGQQVAFNEDGKPAKMPSDFCVKGSNLTVRDADGSVYTAVKQ
jgi:hypothetical protein